MKKFFRPVYQGGWAMGLALLLTAPLASHGTGKPAAGPSTSPTLDAAGARRAPAAVPVLLSVSPNPAAVGSTLTLTGTDLGGATAVNFVGATQTTITNNSGTSLTVVVPAGAATGAVTVTSPGGVSNPLPLVLVTSLTWTGVTSADWATTTNWLPTVVPTYATAVTIPATASPRFQPTVGGVQACANLSVQINAVLTLAGGSTPGDLTASGTVTLASGSTLTQGAGSELYIAQNLTNQGATFNLDPLSEVGFGGPVYQHVIGGAAGITFQKLTLAERGSSGETMVLAVPVRVRRALELYKGATLTTADPFAAPNGSLTLLSDATGTALVKQSDAGSTVVGNVTVQRYIDASGNTGSSGYRHYSSPISNATVNSFRTTVQGGAFVPVVNPAYNTLANPLSLGASAYPNVFSYDESKIVGSPNTSPAFSAFDKGYQSPAAPSSPLVVGRGYAVQIGNAEKVQFTGTLNNGPVTVGGLTQGPDLVNGGWHLVGNPYPSPISLLTTQVGQFQNVLPAVYVFQSTGPYTGRYNSTVNGQGVGVNGLIAVGQAFFVRADPATASVTPGRIAFQNFNRVTSFDATTPVFQRGTPDPRPTLRLSLAPGTQPATAATAQDESIVYFEAGASGAFDGRFDAYKLLNPNGYYLATAAEMPATQPALGLSIDGRAPLTQPLAVPVWLSVPAAGAYVLTATELRQFAPGQSVQLRDALTGTLTNLTSTPSYGFEVAAGAAVAGRFTLLFGTASALATQAGAALPGTVASVYPNPTEPAGRASASVVAVTGLPAAARAVEAVLYNALGQQVRRLSLVAGQGAAQGTLRTDDLAAGVYVLRLTALDGQGMALGLLPAQRVSVR